MPSAHLASFGTSDSTSASLIRRVREKDAQAWERLAVLYSPLVYSWARRAGLRDNDAADVVQDVFRSVFQGIVDFQRERDGSSFRAWLWAITRNHLRLYFRRQGQSPQAVGGSQAHQQMRELPDPFHSDDDSARHDHLRLVHRALELVRGDFSDTTWQAFCRTALQQHSAAEAAAELGLSENAVRQAKFRVLRRLRQELDDMLE